MPEAGRYAVFAGFGDGAYDLEVRAFRPPHEATGTTQRIFIDFDGATIDTLKFGADPGHPQPSNLSPMSSFLADWGLSGGDEDAVIDAILAVVIGGTSLFGGRFSLGLSVVGALIIQAMNTGILLSGYPPEYNLIVKAIVVLAVLLAQSPVLSAVHSVWKARA